MKLLAEKPETNLVVVGHVDHGKSTMIGRLLYDAGALPPAVIRQMSSLDSARSADGVGIDLAYVVDHLREEREFGMTIDTTQVQCETDTCRFVLIDAPGHREFLKNMITGAAQADAALLVVDANEGVKEQTRRHACMLSLVGIEDVVVAVNKMDLAGYDEGRFEKAGGELKEFLGRFGLKPRHILPVSAKTGENISTRSKNMNWHAGPCLTEALNAPQAVARPSCPLRFPIQDTYAVAQKNVLVGRIEAGGIKPGIPAILLPSGQDIRIETIEGFSGNSDEAVCGESIGITLHGSDSAGRGQVIADAEKPPRTAAAIRARIFSFYRGDLTPARRLSLKLATQDIPARLSRIRTRIDSSTLEQVGGPQCIKETEVADVEIKLAAPLVFDRYEDIPEMGRFVLNMDSEPVAGGIILGE